MVKRLSQSLIETATPRPGVAFPAYDRSTLKAGIVHIGPGNFALAHMAYKTHQLMQMGDQDALNYGIITVNLNPSHDPSRPSRRDLLQPQDGLYTVAEQDRAGKNKMIVVGSVVKSVYAPDSAIAAVAQLASPDTRIVSMTITPDEHQSYMTSTGQLNFHNADIVNDLDPNNAPRTILGYIVRGIQEREVAGLPGFTVMNLDNMVHNGDHVANLVQQFALAYDEKLADAIESKYTFPNSMVDRIVPKTSQALLEQVSARTGYTDLSAVPAEPMPLIGSWALEDNFANGRPAWGENGLAQMVPDVLPYELAKLRLLNVSHSLMACLGDLAGMPYIDQVMNDELFIEMIASLMNNETGPTLPQVPGVDMEAYKKEIIARFANEKVQDTTQRVATDAPLAVVLDTARERIAAGASYEMLALNTAAWIRRFGIDTNELGGAIETKHAVKAELVAAARQGGIDPRPVMAITGVFGDLGKDKNFVETVESYLSLLAIEGVKPTIQFALDASHYIVTNNTRPGAAAQQVTAPTPDVK